jgi:uncharacterized protein (TIGR03437 family)
MMAQSPYASTIFFDVTEGSNISANILELLTSDVVQKACGAKTADVNIDSQAGPAWLSLGSTVCMTPARIKVLADPAGLAPGQHLAGIMATIGADTFKLKVELMVFAVPPNLTVEPTTLIIQGVAGSRLPTEQSLLVFNRGGGGPQDFTTAVTSDTEWLTVRGGAGKTDDILNPINAIVDFPNLRPGVYPGSLDVTSGSGAPKRVEVTALARASGTALSVSQTGLLFSIGAAAGTTESAPISIGNQGDGSMPWTADILLGSAFLSAAPPSGTTAAGGSSTLTIAPQTAAKPNTSDLAVGNYYGLVRVSSPGAANSPQYILTVLRVAGGSQTPTVRPGGLILGTAVTGLSGKLVITGSGAAPSTFTISTTSPDGLKWLSATPASGSVTASKPVDITVTANPGLKAGFYPGEVNISFVSGGVTSFRTIGILLVALPAGAKLAAERRATAGCTPSKLGMAQTGQSGNFLAPAALPTPLTFTVVDDCANAVTDAHVVATFSNTDPSLPLTLSDAASGQYSATWVPVRPTAVTITAQATSGALAPAQVRLSGDVSSNKAPFLRRNSIVNILNPKPGAPLAPGTLIQIGGTGLATTDATPSDVPLPTVVNGTSVLIGGYAAPLISLSDGTLTAQLPVELAANSQYPVVVIVNDAISAPDIITVASNTPGIQAAPDGYATAQHPDGTAVTLAAPAAAGEVVSIFLSGLGATDPVVASGVQAPAVEPLARITTPAAVTLNGNPVDVGFAGLVAGQVGLYRIDLTVPPDAGSGDLKLAVTQNGLNSNTVLLTVGAQQ